MSEQNNKSPLLNVALSIATAIRCCTTTSTVTETTVIGNHVIGDPSQTIAPLVKTASSVSADAPITEDLPGDPPGDPTVEE